MHVRRTSTSARPAFRIVASLSLLACLAACGYKGSLYMPPPPPAPDASLTVPPQTSTAPARP